MLPDEDLDDLTGLGGDAVATGLDRDDQRTLGQLAVNAAHEIRRLRAERQPARPADTYGVYVTDTLRRVADQIADPTSHPATRDSGLVRQAAQMLEAAWSELDRLRATSADDDAVDLNRALRAYGDRYLDQWGRAHLGEPARSGWALISRQPIDAAPDEAWVELPQPDDALARLRARIDADPERRAAVDALKREMRDEQREAAMRAAGYRRCGCCGYEDR